MNEKAIERLEQKSVKGSIVERLNRDFAMGPVVSRVLYEQMSGYLKEYAEMEEASIGQIRYLVVGENEGAGKRIEECKRVLVSLTIQHADDLSKLAAGVSAVRQARIERMSNEAADQGGLITHEDLACLLSSSLATIKRDVKKLRSQGIAIPTRGQIQDIGKGVTHKRQIVADYLAGYTYSEIERRQRHSLNSIRRYCEDFIRIVRLAAKGLKVSEIRLITKLSERLIGEYQTLYQECQPDNEYLQLLLADPNRIPDTAAEIERGGLLR